MTSASKLHRGCDSNPVLWDFKGLQAGKVSLLQAPRRRSNRLARSPEIRKSSWGTRTPPLTVIARSPCDEAIQGPRAVAPGLLRCARNDGGVDAAIIGLASATSNVSWLEEIPSSRHLRLPAASPVRLDEVIVAQIVFLRNKIVRAVDRRGCDRGDPRGAAPAGGVFVGGSGKLGRESAGHMNAELTLFASAFASACQPAPRRHPASAPRACRRNPEPGGGLLD
jgi:hypothetical protein